MPLENVEEAEQKEAEVDVSEVDDVIDELVPSRRNTDPPALVRLGEILSTVPRIFSGKTYVGTFLPKKTLFWLIGIAVVIGILAVTIFFFILRARAEEAKAAALIAPYEERLEAAKTLTETDLITGREHVSAVVEDLTKLQSEQPEGTSKRVTTAIATALDEARKTYTAVSGKEEQSELPIFYDLRLALPDFVTSLVTLQANKAVFLDGQKKQLVVLDLAAKNVFVKNLDQLQNMRSISALAENDVALLSDGVQSLPLTEDGAVVEVKEVGDSNKDATFVNSFGTYIYVLNPEKRNIYRYAKGSDEYSDPIGWLQDPLGVQFSSVTSVSVDGDLWITTTDGEVKKFTAGKEAKFTIVGLQEVFSTPIWLYTRENVANLYVLEPGKRRLVILNKNGEFIREVKSNSLASATGIFISDELKKAFVVSGSIIYEISL
jgi:hypothetical protein